VVGRSTRLTLELNTTWQCYHARIDLGTTTRLNGWICWKYKIININKKLQTTNTTNKKFSKKKKRNTLNIKLKKNQKKNAYLGRQDWGYCNKIHDIIIYNNKKQKKREEIKKKQKKNEI